jgi:HEPN domain-containing protein
MGNDVKNSNAWIFFADKDVQIAELAVDNAELSGEVTFHSQQAIEKYLKAFLAENKTTIKKTHDLVELYSEVRKIKDMNLNENMLQDIKDLYIETRYPSNIGLFQDGSLPAIEDAKSYLDFAKSIASIVKSEVGQTP